LRHVCYCLLPRGLKVKVYKTIIQLVVLYGCETWSLTLREEHRLRVFENRVLRKMFGPKRDDIMGEWRKLRNGELRNWYSSADIIREMKSRRMKQAGLVAHMKEGGTMYRVWWESLKEKDHLKDQDVDRWMGSNWTLGRLVRERGGVDSSGSG
jgi:hypothetical protein